MADRCDRYRWYVKIVYWWYVKVWDTDNGFDIYLKGSAIHINLLSSLYTDTFDMI